MDRKIAENFSGVLYLRGENNESIDAHFSVNDFDVTILPLNDKARRYISQYDT